MHAVGLQLPDFLSESVADGLLNRIDTKGGRNDPLLKPPVIEKAMYLSEAVCESEGRHALASVSQISGVGKNIRAAP